MNIGVVSFDSKYKELLEMEETVEHVTMLDKLEGEKIQVDVLLIDGRAVSYRELEKIRGDYPEIPIFYKFYDVKAEVITKSITRICVAYDITPVNEYYTTEQVAKQVLEALTKSNESTTTRVVSFFGTHSGSGVSTTVLNVARAISERVNERVLVLSLNAWDAADYFYDYRGMYLNDLKVDLKSESLTIARLHEAVHKNKNFYHLAGNRDVKIQRFYKSEEIKHLIDVAKEDFDLILIDAGTHFDNALSAQAYVQADLKFIVANQEDKGYRGYFPYTFQQILEPIGAKRDDFMLIINGYQPNVSLINEKDLEEDMEMNRIATVPDMGPIGKVSIRQNRLMYDQADNIYKKPIDVISNLIVSEAQLTERPVVDSDDENKKGVFGLFSKK